jgi:hypothetical protein
LPHLQRSSWWKWTAGQASPSCSGAACLAWSREAERPTC